MIDDPVTLTELCVRVEGRIDNLPFAERAYAIEPDHLATKLAYGVALHHHGEFARARDMLLQAKWQNEDPNTHLGRLIDIHIAMCMHACGEVAEAETILANYRDMSMGADEFAHVNLMQGKFQEGFLSYIDGKNLAHARPLDFCSNEWKGESLVGKRAVLYRGGGFGDYFMFARFFHLLKDRFHASHVALCSDIKSEAYAVYPFVKADSVISCEDIRPDDVMVCDYRNLWHGVTNQDVLEHAAEPYMKALQAPTLHPKAPFNVGLVWKGNPGHAMNHHRSMTLNTLAPIFAVPGTAFYSLQAEGDKDIYDVGLNGFITDLMPRVKDWRDTAGFLGKMDMLISCDSGLAHLAGAMGVPTLVLNYMLTDWRWNRKTERTIWYKNHRIIHQKSMGDWKPVVERARDYLAAQVERKLSCLPSIS